MCEPRIVVAVLLCVRRKRATASHAYNLFASKAPSSRHVFIALMIFGQASFGAVHQMPWACSWAHTRAFRDRQIFKRHRICSASLLLMPFCSFFPAFVQSRDLWSALLGWEREKDNEKESESEKGLPKRETKI